jgi:hypothetical protein
LLGRNREKDDASCSKYIKEENTLIIFLSSSTVIYLYFTVKEMLRLSDLYLFCNSLPADQELSAAKQ